MDQREVLRSAYETLTEDGCRYGKNTPADFDRWRQTLKFLPRDIDSLLDCGCEVGHWLAYVHKHLPGSRLVGLDVARNKILEGKTLYPYLDLRAGFAQDLVELGERFDAVTALETLEHIPEWQDVLKTMLSLARKVVLVTVPYKERIIQTPCIHCGKLTPVYGHLRLYDESSFPEFEGWRLSFGFLSNMGDSKGLSSLPRRVYRRLRPRKSWIAARYTRC
jgi:hypothetical protein